MWSFQEGDAMKTILETFHQMSKIFCKNLGAASWDESHSESLCIHLHRVTADLEECMRPMKKKGFKNYLKVKKYFRKMENYLKDWRYERCAWEVVKSKIKTLLPDVRRLMMEL
ncbi:hypothetical protein SKAU_G00136380 [Synaphobranchus kaupii]|uniref:Interferon a3-like n=1 Tax=Synaphobranchus kaupii TaxID=118154 RepID=A0A9Q1FRI4_SYNKA|nr:hypothetical protein SKAU_G00136380 [Synaphobranchus kaupii]